MADEQADGEAQEKPKGGKNLKLIIAIAAASVLAAGAGIGITAMMMSGGEKTEAAEKADPPVVPKPDGKTPSAPASYVALDPPFVVNFQEGGNARFLQVTVELMSRNPGALETAKMHVPILRNSLVLLFSSQDAATLRSREGKERLRQEALAEVQKVLTQETGKPQVEALYFTSFVMQ